MQASSPWGGTQEVSGSANADREDELRKLLNSGPNGKLELEKILARHQAAAVARGEEPVSRDSPMIAAILQYEMADRVRHIPRPSVSA